MSTGDATLILGSDPREWYEGGDASELLVVQAEGMPRFDYDIHRLAAFENGSTAWAASDVTARLESGHAVALRMTAVFCLDHGVWRVVNWHTSAPQADDPEVIGVELSETMSRLVDEVRSHCSHQKASHQDSHDRFHRSRRLDHSKCRGGR
jgi:hypothetical protein